MTMRPSERFAGYTIVRQLGSGGMGEVYLAQQGVSDGLCRSWDGKDLRAWRQARTR